MLHAGFQLSGGSEEVALLQYTLEGMLVVDHVKFGEQSRDTSYGRYPDGDSIFEFLVVATPGYSNYIAPVDITSVDTTTADTTHDTYARNRMGEEDMMVYPVPTSGPLYVKFNEKLSLLNIPVDVYVYSMSGSIISATQQRSSKLIRLSLENQPKGLYFIRIRTGDRVFVRKVLLF